MAKPKIPARSSMSYRSRSASLYVSLNPENDIALDFGQLPAQRNIATRRMPASRYF